jgi:three-Cys-motif partner protein
MAVPIEGDDGLPADAVGAWSNDKHDRLRRYLDISRAARRRFLTGSSKTATFVDLFCGPGRARVRGTGEWIDGSAVAAWKISREGAAPFSGVYVADIDPVRRAACVERLRRLDAPVHELAGSAVEAATEFVKAVSRYGLHFAFLDPYNLGELDFRIIRALASLKRVDMLVHVSVMDLQRNLGANLDPDVMAFDQFAPGWRENIDLKRGRFEIRRQVVEYWRKLVSELGKHPSDEMELITGEGGQRLYWLLLVVEHALAHKFWQATAGGKQTSLRF